MRIEPLKFKEFDAGLSVPVGGKTFLPGGRRRGEGPPLPPPTYNQEQLKAAEMEAYKKGFLEGTEEGKKQQDSAQAMIERQLAETAERFVEKIGPVFADYRAAMVQIKQDVPKVAMTIARKVASAALDENAAKAVEETAVRCVETMLGEPKISVTVHPELAASLEEKIRQISSKLQSAGEIAVSGDDSLTKTDCRVEWKQGSMIRDTGKLWQEIARVVDNMAATARHDAQAQMEDLKEQLPEEAKALADVPPSPAAAEPAEPEPEDAKEAKESPPPEGEG